MVKSAWPRRQDAQRRCADSTKVVGSNPTLGSSFFAFQPEIGNATADFRPSELRQMRVQSELRPVNMVHPNIFIFIWALCCVIPCKRKFLPAPSSCHMLCLHVYDFCLCFRERSQIITIRSCVMSFLTYGILSWNYW